MFGQSIAGNEFDREGKNAMPEKPVVKLIGTDGNVFSIIGNVSHALKRAGQPDKAEEFTNRALASESYDAVLRLAMTYCKVK